MSRDSVKSIRETLCFAQAAVARDPSTVARKHVERLERLIALCDLLRPLATDGKHGDLHTLWCGCEEAATQRRAARLQSVMVPVSGPLLIMDTPTVDGRMLPSIGYGGTRHDTVPIIKAGKRRGFLDVFRVNDDQELWGYGWATLDERQHVGADIHGEPEEVDGVWTFPDWALMGVTLLSNDHPPAWSRGQMYLEPTAQS